METNMIVLVTRRYFVAIRDEEAVVSCGKMVVARMNEIKPAGRSGDVDTRYRLTVATYFTALAASGWVNPAADRLVSIAPGEEAQ